MNLPDKPLVSIRPGGRFAPIDLKSLWAYRELLYFLTWRDVKVRYKQTALGAAWAIIQHEGTAIYYGTNTGGRAWLQTCVELPPTYCDPPAEFMAAHYARHGENP